MIYIFLVFAFGIGLLLIIWQGSLLLAFISGAPSVFANQDAIEDSLKLAKLKKGELLIDLGCGDARVLIIGAKKFGARGIGVEKSPYCYLLSRFNVWQAGQSQKIKLIYGDFKVAEVYLKKADVVYLYLLPHTLARIEKWLFANLRSQAKVISIGFAFQKRKSKLQSSTINLNRKSAIYLYQK